MLVHIKFNLQLMTFSSVHTHSIYKAGLNSIQYIIFTLDILDETGQDA